LQQSGTLPIFIMRNRGVSLISIISKEKWEVSLVFPGSAIPPLV
jgi:hypothetical protein